MVRSWLICFVNPSTHSMKKYFMVRDEQFLSEKGEEVMMKLIDLVHSEINKTEKLLKKVEAFLTSAPVGCLKWQHRGQKIYYYHQISNNRDKSEDETQTDTPQKSKRYKEKRKYIKSENMMLAENLAQKHYYILLKEMLESNLHALKQFVKVYKQDGIDEVFNDLSKERKDLITPIQESVEAKIEKWKEEVYEKNIMYPENLRYETEQGELVRSKSEVIIANILYQNKKNILYKYERPLGIMDNGHIKTIYPDFTIINIHTGNITYWEHAGMMDAPHYVNDFVKKMNIYVENGLFPGKDVVVTYETQENVLDIGVVKKMVEELA